MHIKTGHAQNSSLLERDELLLSFFVLMFLLLWAITVKYMAVGVIYITFLQHLGLLYFK